MLSQVDIEPTEVDILEETTGRPWYVGDDDLFIHPHWWKYDMHLIPDWHFYTAGVLIGAIGIVGIIGNGLVVLTYFKEKSLRTPPNMFVINLAMSDLVFSAVNGFPLFSIASFQRRWNWGMTACVIYAWFGAVFGLGSIYTNAAIALDRFFVIVQPIQTMQRMNNTRAGIIIMTIWIWCNVIAILPFVGFGRYIPEGFQTSCTFDYISQDWNNRGFNIALYSLAFALPMTVIVTSYWQIVKAVARHEQEMVRMAQKLGAKNMRSGNNIRTDIKTAKVSATIICFWFMTWIPYAVVCFLGVLGHTDHLTPHVTEIPVIFAKASAMYNPIIYAISHPKFREGMERTAPFLFTCCPTKKKGLRERGSESGVSQMSECSDSGSVRKTNIRMKEVQSTETINTIAGEMDKQLPATAT